MNCPRCNTPMRMQVHATISAPSSLMHKFSKTNLRSKDVWLVGVNWETADHICRCGHVVDGYGNYVSRLEKRVKELEAKP